MPRFGRAARLMVAASILATAAIEVRAEEITLAAGAGFRRPIAELATAFEARSGHKVLQIYGHLGQVMAQARESRQIAIVCGDRAVLQQARGVSFARMERLGMGKLVIAYRKGVTLETARDIARADIRRIGIPDQANAIYGKAGRQFLERTQLAGAVDPRLIAVATVPQVTSYVVSGEVDAGFVNATDAIGAGAAIGGFVEVDPALYDPVEVSCGLREEASPSAVAEGFAAFLKTDEARRILTRYGL